MTDSVLIQNGCAHQIWRDTPKDKVPPMHPSLMEHVVEVKSGTVNEGDVWNGKKFKAPTEAKPDPQAALKASDREMARITEDLIDALITNGALAETDLPDRARAHIATRKTLRASLKEQRG